MDARMHGCIDSPTNGRAHAREARWWCGGGVVAMEWWRNACSVTVAMTVRRRCRDGAAAVR
eukprot:3482755-Alexandrium_andersonii.AAC.1